MEGSERVIAVIQARVGSQRLPGKVLHDVGGAPLLSRVIERVQAASTVDGVVVATTDADEDDPVAALAVKSGAGVYRGSADDVLDRMYRAALVAGADVVVRITADDPFKDPDVIDAVVGAVLADPNVDYASNTIEPTFPEGVDVECLRMGALESAWRRATLPSDREHVTPFVWRQPDAFRLRSVRNGTDLSGLRWTIDHPADLEFARAVQARLPVGDLSMAAVLDVLDAHPELQALNAMFERNEGYQRSLERQAMIDGPATEGNDDDG
jgi:spore coat polysaccharide biosynthesis protein SpsF